MTRAVLCDVYGTLLRAGQPPSDADAHWERLCATYLAGSRRPGRAEFLAACERVVARQHEEARRRGMAHPEVQWPKVVAEALPGFDRLSAAAQAEFVFRQMQTVRTVSLMAGAGAALTALRRAGVLLGIVSNSQAYTRRELRQAGLDLGMFDPAVSFWSFEHGFSKPDPRVFQTVAARLEARGLAAQQILMVGDRVDNDMAPARALGWQTWRLTEVGGDGVEAGDWDQLRARLLGGPGEPSA